MTDKKIDEMIKEFKALKKEVRTLVDQISREIIERARKRDIYELLSRGSIPITKEKTRQNH